MATTLGQHIEGKYELIEKLRDGGMGAIFKVRHRLLGEMRVIKLMRPQLQADEGLKARFMREARVAIKLKHPHIAQLYDFSVDDTGTAFIVMEYIDGLTLQDLILRIHPLPLGFVLEVAIQGLKALSYLHRKGFIHRDIAPDNLMVSEDEEGMPFVKLIDLGIAKGLEAGSQPGLTKTGFFLGKVRYSSPEQFSPKAGAKIDARCDLYSFGIVLYELLTARYPISGNAPSSLIAGHLLRPPLDFAKSDPEGRVPEAVRGIVMKALAKKPDARFATASDFARQLRKVQKALDEPEEKIAATVAKARAAPAPVTRRAGTGGAQRQLDAQFGMAPTPVPREPTTQVTMHDPAATPAPTDDPANATAVERPRPPGAEMATVIGISHKVLIVKARAKLEKGDAEGALAQLRKAAELAPNNAEVEAAIAEAEGVLERDTAKRIETEVAEMVTMIERELGNGRLEAAERLLKSARAAFGEVEAFTTLSKRLEGQKRLTSLLQEAEEKASSDDHQGATLLLREAQNLEPESEEVASRLAASEAALEREAGLTAAVEEVERHLAAEDEAQAGEAWEAAAERFGEDAALTPLRARIDQAIADRTQQAGIAQALKTIEADLERNALEAAERAYRVAVEGYGEEPFAALKERLDAQAKEAELEGYLGIARLYLGLGRYQKGLGELRKARELVPDHPEIEKIQQQIEAALAKQEAARQRAAEVEAARQEIEAKLEAGGLDEARKMLAASQKELGENVAFVEVRLKLEAREQQALLASHLEAARTALDKDDPDAASKALDAARELEAEHEEIAALHSKVEVLRAAQERERAVAAAAEEITALLGEKKLDEAETRLEQAVEELGAAAPLDACRDELVQAQRRQQAEELVRGAVAKRKAKDFAAAIADLEEAFSLEPKLAKAKKQLETTKRAQRKHEEEERARALAAAGEEIAALLADGDLDQAAARHEVAAKEFGAEAGELGQLGAKIEAERQARLEAEVRDLLLEAEELVEDGEIDEARQRLEAVITLDADNESARQQLRSIDEIAAAVERIRKGEAIVKGVPLAAEEPPAEAAPKAEAGPKVEAASKAEAIAPAEKAAPTAEAGAKAETGAKPAEAPPKAEGKPAAEPAAKPEAKKEAPKAKKAPKPKKPAKAPRQAAAAAAQQAQQNLTARKPAPKEPRSFGKQRSLPPWLVIALALVVLIIIGVILWSSRNSGDASGHYPAEEAVRIAYFSSDCLPAASRHELVLTSLVSIEEGGFLWSQA